MADTDQIAIARLGPEDASAGLALSSETNWDQNEADWRFFLTQATVFGVRDNQARLIATAALLPYSFNNAWISMETVTPQHFAQHHDLMMSPLLIRGSKSSSHQWLHRISFKELG